MDPLWALAGTAVVAKFTNASNLLIEARRKSAATPEKSNAVSQLVQELSQVAGRMREVEGRIVKRTNSRTPNDAKSHLVDIFEECFKIDEGLRKETSLPPGGHANSPRTRSTSTPSIAARGKSQFDQFQSRLHDLTRRFVGTVVRCFW